MTHQRIETLSPGLLARASKKDEDYSPGHFRGISKSWRRLHRLVGPTGRYISAGGLCVTGVLSNLQKIIPFHQITAIIIPHLHLDHFLDLVPFRFAIK
ncbi:MAG: hypothetical protein EXR50_03655 [Dehalococcoidia bacterium]|nr:hypothetical protein [Dehalococcoidia bacterium]